MSTEGDRGAAPRLIIARNTTSQVRWHDAHAGDQSGENAYAQDNVDGTSGRYSTDLRDQVHVKQSVGYGQDRASIGAVVRFS